MNRHPAGIGRWSRAALAGAAACLLLAGTAWAAALPAAAVAPAPVEPPAEQAAEQQAKQQAEPLAEPLARLVRLGDHQPAQALAALQALPAPPDAAGRRVLALARAEIQARSGSAADAAAALGQAVVAASAVAPALAEADGQYLQALQAERDGQGLLPALASAALALYDRHCTGRDATCEQHPRGRLHQLLAMQALARQQADQARHHAQSALAHARAGDDLWQQTAAHGLLAQAAAAGGDAPTRRQQLAQAQALARRSGDAVLAAQLALTEASTLAAAEAGRADIAASAGRVHTLLLQALAEARRAGAGRLEALAWGQLSDLALQHGHTAQALQATARGLALARPLGELRLARLLEANAMLAQVRLGQAAPARQTLERLLAAWSAAGEHRTQLTALRQFGDALAATGDLPGALALHHRERALGRELNAATREAALAELRGRNDREAQQRDIQVLERDNAVQAAALENQTLVKRLWMLGGGALALAVLLVLLLARRVRVANRALARNQRQLRHQSEHDALTGLANRRHAQARLQGRREDEHFRGGLLMLDIDHFKQINDRHGHAAGDAVLVQVAARLAQALSPGALAARWGGEEFLVALPEPLAPGALRALARRLMLALSATPVTLPGGQPLAVSVSIGHAGFPLPPHGLPLGLDQAINLVDMALYLAKAQGRHRAVGLARADASDAAALRRLEADLERAWRDGQVQLDIDAGPPHAA